METNMTYTKAEIRAAIYRAADTIQHNHSLWNYSNCHIGDCGTPMCAAGWIGFYLGAQEGDRLSTALESAGFRKGGTFHTAYSAFEHDMGTIDPLWHLAPDKASAVLRAYADRYFPADASRPFDDAYLAFKRALAQDAGCDAPTPASVTP